MSLSTSTAIIPRTIKGVVWDLDGTIVDSLSLSAELWARILPNYGIAIPTLETLKLHYHGTLEDTISGATGLTHERLEPVVKDFLRLQDEIYASTANYLFDDAVYLMAQVHEAGLQQFIITNRSHTGRGSASPRVLAKLPPLNAWIRGVVCGDDNADFHKPDPRVLDALEAEHGLHRKELMVIGDQCVDGELALHMGAKAVLVSREDQTIPYIERLGQDWQQRVTIVSSLRQVKIEPRAKA